MINLTTDGPAELFIVDKMSGEITTREGLHRDMKQYVLSVAANDEVNLRSTTCKVINSFQTDGIFLKAIYNGPHLEKTCLWGFRQSQIQTSLFSYRDFLEN